MRYLAVGNARAHVLHFVPHLIPHAQQLEKALVQLNPTLILVDRSKQEWANIGRPSPLDQRMVQALGESRAVSPDVVWRLARDYAKVEPACRVALLHSDLPPIPKGNGGLKTLDGLIKKEGFERGASPVQNLKKLYYHYIKRCPDLWEYVESRRDATAKHLRAGLSTSPQRPVVLVPSPDVDEVCQRARQ